LRCTRPAKSSACGSPVRVRGCGRRGGRRGAAADATRRRAAEAHRRRHVEHEQHRQLALLDELLHERPALARGDVPVDRAQVVALGELAHFLELDARTAEDGAVAAGHHVGHHAVGAHLDAPRLREQFRVERPRHGDPCLTAP